MRRVILVLSTLLLAGCNSHTLETGYNYTPLGDSPTKRRGYYADPFSPEARMAQQEKTTEAPEGRRPIPGQ